MDYFRILNLKKEPFSNSPDPAFFFQSRHHQACLQKLELSLRMRRGLNVVIGDVGTGKTTLCRQIIRKFADDDDFETHLVLDPDFGTPREFLASILEMFDEASDGPPPDDDWKFKERIKTAIFSKGVDQGKTTVLIIDEGQKIPVFCLEILREFLNYETNEFKLLQIVIFAQKEFDQTLKAHANFADRVNLYHLLAPLKFTDTRRMIQYRIQKSSDGSRELSLFSYPALWAIYRATGGYPRKIINLCHQSLLAMIIQNRSRAGWLLVKSCVRRALAQPPVSRRRVAVIWAGVVLMILLTGGSVYLQKADFPIASTLEFRQKLTGLSPKAPAEPKLQKPVIEDKEPTEPQQKVAGDSTKAAEIPLSLKSLQQDASSTLARTPEPDTESHPENADSVSDVAPSVEIKKESAEQKALLDPPSALGRVALKRSEILSWMCVKVYGMYNREIRKLMAKANPKMANPDRLESGRYIVFPADPVTVRHISGPVWWVQVAETDSLAEGFATLRSYKSRKAPIRMIPHWNPRDGLKFKLMQWRYHFDRVSAQNGLNRLTPSDYPEGRVFSKWEPDTMFYADPYLGRGS